MLRGDEAVMSQAERLLSDCVSAHELCSLDDRAGLDSCVLNVSLQHPVETSGTSPEHFLRVELNSCHDSISCITVCRQSVIIPM